uniref:Potassium channel domain-containing protein n=1 Tax=Clastoptera arizonana TaxID=38151 RepID=A0A1B6DG40_9HEMI
MDEEKPPLPDTEPPFDDDDIPPIDGERTPLGSRPPPPTFLSYLPPKPRPHITLKIPNQGIPTVNYPGRPMTYYYGSPVVTIPLTPTTGLPSNVALNGPQFGVIQAYPNKASEFMFKQFEGFRDFTMTTAKSGLSVGEKFAFWMYGKIRTWSRKWFTHFFLLAVVAAYSMAGAALFMAVEGVAEKKHMIEIKREREETLCSLKSLMSGKVDMPEKNCSDEWLGLAAQRMRPYEQIVIDHYKQGHIDREKPIWSYWSAVFYCGTVFTTIGYGHISPSTTTGRAITIVYAIFGIPLFLILLADFGKLFTRGIKFVWAFVRRVYYTGSCKKVRKTVPVQEVMKGVQMVYDMATFRRPSQLPPGIEMDDNAPPPLPPRVPFTPGDQPATPAPSNFAIDDEFNLPISVAITILLIYIFCGATVFYIWEQWGFFESFYFVFISMSTIGFGDFVPQNQMYMMASIVYLVFGLALTSMCINVVQEKLSDSFRQASAKIGATIGLRVAEEDGSITPVPPIAVEVAEVHGVTMKKPPVMTPYS